MSTRRTIVGLTAALTFLTGATALAAEKRGTEPAGGNSAGVADKRGSGDAREKPARAVFPPGEGRINVNTAGEAELMKLEGVGKAGAKRIIEHRTAHGEFKRPEDVRKVPGIGNTVFERNRERIAVK